MSRSDRTIVEILEPLVYEEMKVWSVMGGRNLEKCQAILYEWREWLQNHWKEDENIKTNKIGKYSVWFNKFSKDVILFYALKGYKFFANSQKEDSEKLMKMGVKAHAIELGPQFKKPRIIPVDPLRINVKLISSFQLADDLFSNPEKYIQRDKDGNINLEKSGWKPDDSDYSSPIFLWQVLASYETNLFSFEYFVRAQELAKKGKEEKE